MAQTAVVDQSLKFIAQRQGRVVVIQCLDCGEHMTVSVILGASRWQREHAASCPGDEGKESPDVPN